MHSKIVFIVLLLTFTTFAAKDYSKDYKAKKAKTSYYGKDPLAFQGAEEMYDVADTLPYDSDIVLPLIKRINNKIKKGYLLEQKAVWNDIIKLEPYRKTKEVQQCVDIWAAQIAKTIKKKKDKQVTFPYKRWYKRLAQRKQAMGDSILHDAKTEALLDTVRQTLVKVPHNLDLRNNFALIKMYQNFDLLAQLELKIVTEISPKYRPAYINLTVVNERLGKRESAQILSRSLLNGRYVDSLKKQPNFINSSHWVSQPSILFNAAWYENINGNYKNAKKIGKKLHDIDENSDKYNEFFDINQSQGVTPIDRGLSFYLWPYFDGAFETRKGKLGIITAIILSVVLGLYVLVKLFDDAKWWYGVLLYAILYTLFWGVVGLKIIGITLLVIFGITIIFAILGSS